MKSKKVLFINQEMTPYVNESKAALDGRELPQSLQEQGCEIRTFMPRWGTINERRNQLHEVIRLSGMNIIIDDTDHPLIIKVASLPAARMQVYFIDNDDYFHKRALLTDDKGEEYADNVERSIFYARGVLETVKKLRWCPDVICCQGWAAAVAPFYIKTAYAEEPPFVNAKVVTALYSEMPDAQKAERFMDCLNFRDANKAALESAGVDLSQPDSLARLAIAFSDGVVKAEEGVSQSLMDCVAARNIPVLDVASLENESEGYNAFFDQVVG